MRYLPHTEADIEEMLKAVGVGSLDALFAQIPENSRREHPRSQGRSFERPCEGIKFGCPSTAREER